MSKYFLKRICGNIKRFRLEKGLTQKTLSLKTEISRSSIAMIEAGRRDLTISKLFKIAEILEVDAGDLLR